MQTQIRALIVAIGVALGGCGGLRSQNPPPAAVPASPTPAGTTAPVSSAASPSPSAATPRTTSRPPLTVRILQNSEYYILAKGATRLSNGRYEDKATGRSFVLGEVFDYGDLNQDKIPDAVGVIQVTVPDSGKFSYLVASVNDAGTARNISAEFLGGGVDVTQLTIKPDKKVEVVMQQGNATITRMYTLKDIQLPEKARSPQQPAPATLAPNKSP